MWIQQTPRSAHADHSLCSPHEEAFGPWLPIICTLKTLIILGSGQWADAHAALWVFAGLQVILLVLSRGGSFCKVINFQPKYGKPTISGSCFNVEPNCKLGSQLLRLFENMGVRCPQHFIIQSIFMRTFLRKYFTFIFTYRTVIHAISCGLKSVRLGKILREIW